MTECPVCESIQIVYVVGPRVTTCYYCGATWIQDGNTQTTVSRPAIPAPMLYSPGLADVGPR
jgi:ribosomal protein S27E